MRESRKEHWEAFWTEAEGLSLDDVYDNGGRILREIFEVCDPAGMRVLEVGAGTGRDSIALARAGARVVTLDYAPRSLDLIRQASERAGVEVEMVGGDGLALPFPDFGPAAKARLAGAASISSSTRVCSSTSAIPCPCSASTCGC